MSGCDRASLVTIRRERETDARHVRRVHERAFGRQVEADLVAALDAAGAVSLSFVAEHGGELVGHIVFSPVTIDVVPVRAVGLAPIAVAPDWQRKGIGSRLVRAGLEELRSLGYDVVVVLGHPDYYSRFGFVPASRYGLRWEHDCPDEAFMALELRSDALTFQTGIVRYRREFSTR